PETLLERRVEAAILDHANPRVLDGHVLAAAFEAPLDDADRELLGDAALERAAKLPELRKTKAGYVWAGRDYPAARVPLRSTGPEAFTIVDGSSGTILGIVEQERAYSTVHEGAVYLPLGASFRVQELDLESRTAVVEPFAGDYYTQAKKETTTAIVEAQRAERRLGVELSFGRVVVTEQVVGYQKKSIQTQESLELVALTLPQTEFDTEAIWFAPEPWMLEGLEEMPRLLGALHAAEHSLIALLPLWAMCDRWDIGGLSTNLHFQTRAPMIYVSGDGWEQLSEEERQGQMQEYMALGERPETRGGADLGELSSSTTVRVKGGETLTTDGPFAETKEYLGGLYLVECDNLDDAI